MLRKRAGEKFVAWTLMLGAILSWMPAGARADDVTVRVSGMHSGRGEVLGLLCRESEFLRFRCEHAARTAARSGTVQLSFPDVSPGGYAITVVHDENGNGKLDRNPQGIPIEGYGFSNNATGYMGPPSFRDAEIDVDPSHNLFTVEMRY